jgi:hypothetical protein
VYFSFWSFLGRKAKDPKNVFSQDDTLSPINLFLFEKKKNPRQFSTLGREYLKVLETFVARFFGMFNVRTREIVQGSLILSNLERKNCAFSKSESIVTPLLDIAGNMIAPGTLRRL